MEQAEERRTAALAGIERRSLKQIIVQRIKEALAQTELQPGQWITELGLAKKFGVAQNTLREALIELEHQGFVERVSARKTRITALSRQDTDEIYAIRVPLELLVVEQLARASNVNWQEMDRACERMSIASKAQILQDFENADLDFHRAMWSLVGNRHLTDILERLVGKLFAYEAMVIRRRHIPPSNFKIQFKQHASLLRALKAGEVEAAKQALVGSMDRTWEDDLGLPEKSDFREL